MPLQALGVPLGHASTRPAEDRPATSRQPFIAKPVLMPRAASRPNRTLPCKDRARNLGLKRSTQQIETATTLRQIGVKHQHAIRASLAQHRGIATGACGSTPPCPIRRVGFHRQPAPLGCSLNLGIHPWSAPFAHDRLGRQRVNHGLHQGGGNPVPTARAHNPHYSSHGAQGTVSGHTGGINGIHPRGHPSSE